MCLELTEPGAISEISESRRQRKYFIPYMTVTDKETEYTMYLTYISLSSPPQVLMIVIIIYILQVNK